MGQVREAALHGGNQIDSSHRLRRLDELTDTDPADTHELPGGGGTRIQDNGGYSGRGTTTTVTWLTGGAARTI